MTVGAAAVSGLSLATSGDFGRAAPLALLLVERNGELVLETTGGVPTREGGLLGLLIVGLSHEEKKSSPGSPAGVSVPSPAPEGTSVMTTSSGNL